MISIKKSRASKARWAAIPPEKRSEIMRALAKKKQRMLTVEQRRRHSRKMFKAKILKYGK